MKVKLWGTRGSVPVTGKNYCKYGGNTPCIEVSMSDEFVFIFDAGSGIRKLGSKLTKEKIQKDIFLFFSHFHSDHIIGLPFFAPFYNKDYTISIYGAPYIYDSIEEIIDLILKPPLFAITKDEFKSKFSFHNIDENFSFKYGELKVETIKLNHSHPTLGFKITNDKKTVVYFTDNELIQNNHSSENLEKLIYNNHKELLDFCKNVDILIHDSSYSINDYNSRVGWGHSSNFAAAMFAHLAKVKSLYLFHYDPEYDDAFIDKLLDETKFFLQEIGSEVNCVASSDEMEINF